MEKIMSTEASGRIVDPVIAGRLFVSRVVEGRVEILLVMRESDGLLILPGVNRYIGERTVDLVDRIADGVGIHVRSYDHAGRLLNEHDHPVPVIQRVFLATNWTGDQARGRWVRPDQLEGVLAPDQWPMVVGALKYKATPVRKREEFNHQYKGIATEDEIARFDRRVAADNSSEFDDYVRDIGNWLDSERYHPAEFFREHIRQSLQEGGYID
jgi:hypothetical protein